MNRTNNNNTYEKALELLPWYALGLLPTDERALVDKALETYPELQKELEAEKKIIPLIKETKEVFNLSAVQGSDERLAIIFENKVFKAKPQNTKNKVFVFLQNIFPTSKRQFQYVSFAAMGVVTIGLLVSFIYPIVNNQESTFYPAAAKPSVESSQSNAIVVIVGLNVKPNNKKLISLLDKYNAEITTINGKKGMYHIKVSKKMNTSDFDEMILALTKNEELAWFVGEAY